MNIRTVSIMDEISPFGLEVESIESYYQSRLLVEEDRYPELISVGRWEYGKNENKLRIREDGDVKGYRVTILDKNTGQIFYEYKYDHQLRLIN